MQGSSLWNDTIVAIATANGPAAIAVIRLSGTDAINICNGIFPSKDLLKVGSHTAHVGYLHFNDQLLDEVVITVFKGPHSYTGEHVAEISCHASSAVQESILAACIHLGARLARAGEFTQRAFLAGKMDLTQAEAVADLIASNTSAGSRASLHNLKGGFKNDLNEIREKLIEFSALLELELDFAEEDVEFADRRKFEELLSFSISKVGELISSFTLGNAVTHGVKVAIVGKPNAGKSTLLNTLLNYDRAIVSDIAGTTRDTVEESLNIQGIAFHFIDTAGIRSHSTDEIENLGIRKSLQKMEQADIVILLTENAEEDIPLLGDTANKNLLVVINKIDKARVSEFTPGYVYISAKNNTGIDELRTALYEKVIQGEVNVENTLITNTRHLQHLQQIQLHLRQIQQSFYDQLSTDLIAPDIKLCLQEIGELTGTITNENVLDYVFSKFCIGK